MTEKELSQLYWLNKETEQMQRELAELRQKGVSTSTLLTGMPRVSGKRDKIGDYVSDIMILEKTIDLNLQKIFRERNKLEKYISNINDSEIRLIMRLRHINGMTWGAIGEETGYTKQGVHIKYKRYFKSVDQFDKKL